jgi:hypothetical protein
MIRVCVGVVRLLITRRVMCVQLLFILAIRRRCRRRRCLLGVQARLDGWVRTVLLTLLKFVRLRLVACPLNPSVVPQRRSTAAFLTKISSRSVVRHLVL